MNCEFANSVMTGEVGALLRWCHAREMSTEFRGARHAPFVVIERSIRREIASHNSEQNLDSNAWAFAVEVTVPTRPPNNRIKLTVTPLACARVAPATYPDRWADQAT